MKPHMTNTDNPIDFPKENEPSWMQDYQDCQCPDFEARCFSDKVFRMMQKHARPAELTLTPDEIFDIWDEHTDYDGEFVTSVDEFVFAILRKASEK